MYRDCAETKKKDKKDIFPGICVSQNESNGLWQLWVAQGAIIRCLGAEVVAGGGNSSLSGQTHALAPWTCHNESAVLPPPFIFHKKSTDGKNSVWAMSFLDCRHHSYKMCLFHPL